MCIADNTHDEGLEEYILKVGKAICVSYGKIDVDLRMFIEGVLSKDQNLNARLRGKKSTSSKFSNV